MKTLFLYKTLIDWVSSELVGFPALNVPVYVTNFVAAGSHVNQSATVLTSGYESHGDCFKYHKLKAAITWGRFYPGLKVPALSETGLGQTG